MMMMIKRWLFCVCLSILIGAITGRAANDFSADSACLALYRFENNLNDSKNTYHLTDAGTIAFSAVTPPEGSYSGDFEVGDASDYAYLTNANQPADFWGKGTQRVGSFCCWISPESWPAAGAYRWIASKSLNTSGHRAWALGIYNNSGTYQINFKVGQTNVTEGDVDENHLLTPTTAFVIDQWYHIGITADASGNFYIRLWDDTNSQVTTLSEAGQYGAMSVSDEEFRIGNLGTGVAEWDGNIDEAVVFKDVLTSAEIDAIRNGTYGAPAGSDNATWWQRRK